MVTSSALDVGGELWQHIGDHYSEAYAAKIMRDVLRTIAQVCCLCCITSHVATSRCACAICRSSTAESLTSHASCSSMSMAWCGGTSSRRTSCLQTRMMTRRSRPSTLALLSDASWESSSRPVQVVCNSVTGHINWCKL